MSSPSHGFKGHLFPNNPKFAPSALTSTPEDFHSHIPHRHLQHMASTDLSSHPLQPCSSSSLPRRSGFSQTPGHCQRLLRPFSPSLPQKVPLILPPYPESASALLLIPLAQAIVISCQENSKELPNSSASLRFPLKKPLPIKQGDFFLKVTQSVSFTCLKPPTGFPSHLKLNPKRLLVLVI